MRKNCVFTLIWCKVRCCLCDHRRFFEHLKFFFFHFWSSHCDECFIPALLELEQCLHGVSAGQSSVARGCADSQQLVSLFSCVCGEVFLFLHWFPRLHAALIFQVLANIWHVVMVSSLLLWQWLFVSFSLQDWKLPVFSFLSLHTHTVCICVFGSSLSCKCRSDSNSYFYLTIMLKWFSVYMFPSCVIMNVMWM